MKKRLESLDALRGFDLLCLVAISDLVEELAEVIDKPWMSAVMECFTHKTWEGFSPWVHVHGWCGDTIFPKNPL